MLYRRVPQPVHAPTGHFGEFLAKAQSRQANAEKPDVAGGPFAIPQRWRSSRTAKGVEKLCALAPWREIFFLVWMRLPASRLVPLCLGG